MVGQKRGQAQAPNRIKEYWNLWKQEPVLHRLTFYLLVLVGFGLRLGYIFQTVRNDEAYTYLAFAANPLKVGLSYYPVPNNHLLHTLFAHFSTMLFGNNVVALRLPVFIAGVLVVPAMYLLVRKLYNKNAGLLAMGLVAVSSGMVNFSTQARGYMIQTLLLIILILVGIYLINKNTIGGWIAFTIVSVLGLYTIPTFLYFFPAVMIWVFLSRFFRHYDRGKLIKRSLASLGGIVALTLILYIPVFLRSGFDAFKGDSRFSGGLVTLPWSKFIQGIPRNIRDVWAAFNLGIPTLAVIVLVVGIIVATVFYRNISRVGYNLPLIILAWTALVYLEQRQIAFPRVFVPLIPLYLGFAAMGLYATGNLVVQRVREFKTVKVKAFWSYVLLFALVAILAFSLVVSEGPYQLDEMGQISSITMRDAKKVTAVLKRTLRPGGMVFAQPGLGTHPLEYYFRQYKIPKSYLVCNVAQQSDWEKNIGNFIVRSFLPKDVGKIKRAIFVTSFREAQPPKSVLFYAESEFWLDYTNFKKTENVYESDWSAITVFKRTKAATRAR